MEKYTTKYEYLDVMIVYFIAALEGNLQWNNWCCQMTDYLKGFIVKIKLNFPNALDNKRESIYWWQISSKTLVCLEWGNLINPCK